MFVDASALCAVLLNEPERVAILPIIREADELLISPITIWETVRAVVRETDLDPDTARTRVHAFLALNRFDQVMIGPVEEEAAVAAFARYGKTRHPARLNMGDCFAYACARAHETTLLFKGEDFARTDIARVWSGSL